jgi:hypothetical protein
MYFYTVYTTNEIVFKLSICHCVYYRYTTCNRRKTVFNSIFYILTSELITDITCLSGNVVCCCCYNKSSADSNEHMKPLLLGILFLSQEQMVQIQISWHIHAVRSGSTLITFWYRHICVVWSGSTLFTFWYRHICVVWSGSTLFTFWYRHICVVWSGSTLFLDW